MSDLLVKFGPGWLPAAELGQPNGVAGLDSSGYVPDAQLPPAVVASAFTRGKQRFSLSGGDISNGFVIFSQLTKVFSVTAGVQGLGLLEESLDGGTTGDYVLSTDGGSGHTKLAWVNDLVTLLKSGDVIFVEYAY